MSCLNGRFNVTFSLFILWVYCSLLISTDARDVSDESEVMFNMNSHLTHVITGAPTSGIVTLYLYL